MADEQTSKVETGPVNSEVTVEDRPRPEAARAPTEPTTGEGQQESRTKGLLREAIHKVMEEIDYHEREAKKHVQQAEALRKDLRESFAFLRERKAGGQPTTVPGEDQSTTAVKQKSTEPEKDSVPAAKRQRVEAKKKNVGRKAK